MAPSKFVCAYCWLSVFVCLAFGRELVGASPARVAASAGPVVPRALADRCLLRPSEVAERIAVLRTEIAYHDELYFKQSAPVISDASYDQLKRELASLEEALAVNSPEGGVVAEVGDDRVGSFETGHHRMRMLSLNKCYAETELRAFDGRLLKQLGRRELDYVVEPKFDGLAISVTFEKGEMIRALTRGNGSEGDDVTANVRRIPTLPPTLRAGLFGAGAGAIMPESVELRGEVYISDAGFARLNQERENAGELPFSNPRNLAAGTIKQGDPGIVAQRRLEIVFYGMGACEPTAARPDSQQALLRQLRAWGLPTIAAPRLVRGADALWQAVQVVGRERAKFGFPTDGAVVKLDSVALQNQLGATSQAPLWAIAYKYVPARVETQLRGITLQVGRTGVLTPVAELVPVKLGGSTVSRASLFNADEIARRDIRVGDFVYLEKAGEVIPSIAGVNRARRAPAALAYVFPELCPSCRCRLVQAVAAAAWRCPNSNCAAQVKRRVEHFASAGCVGIAGLGPAMADKLVQSGWVKTVADIYRLRRQDLLALGGNVEKSTDRFLVAIEQSKHAELWRFINGLGIPQVGAVTSRNLARRFGGLAALAHARPEDFPAAEAVTARAVLAHFAKPENQTLVESLLLSGVRPAAEFGETTPLSPGPQDALR